jgi:hypothetical protein
MKNLDTLSLINVFKNKIDCSIMDTVGLHVPIISKSETFLAFTSLIFQDLVLQQGSSWLQTTLANLWAFFNKNNISLRVHFPLLNPARIHHYHVTCIILFYSIKF